MQLHDVTAKGDNRCAHAAVLANELSSAGASKELSRKKRRVSNEDDDDDDDYKDDLLPKRRRSLQSIASCSDKARCLIGCRKSIYEHVKRWAAFQKEAGEWDAAKKEFYDDRAKSKEASYGDANVWIPVSGSR